jgi:hypothetical protein
MSGKHFSTMEKLACFIVYTIALAKFPTDQWREIYNAKIRVFFPFETDEDCALAYESAVIALDFYIAFLGEMDHAKELQ